MTNDIEALTTDELYLVLVLHNCESGALERVIAGSDPSYCAAKLRSCADAVPRPRG